MCRLEPKFSVLSVMRSKNLFWFLFKTSEEIFETLEKYLNLKNTFFVPERKPSKKTLEIIGDGRFVEQTPLYKILH